VSRNSWRKAAKINSKWAGKSGHNLASNPLGDEDLPRACGRRVCPSPFPRASEAVQDGPRVFFPPSSNTRDATMRAETVLPVLENQPRSDAIAQNLGRRNTNQRDQCVENTRAPWRKKPLAYAEHWDMARRRSNVQHTPVWHPGSGRRPAHVFRARLGSVATNRAPATDRAR
jgi:hypothetical protein